MLLSQDEDVDMTAEVDQPKSSQLWVDKYQAGKFLDLLTDEATNRNVLTWLKSWDEVVFPNKRKGQKLKAPEQEKKKNSFFQNRVDVKAPEEIFNLNNKRVIMLYGPPGTGKSTMAKVLATHCGYRPQEVNASDCRSGS